MILIILRVSLTTVQQSRRVVNPPSRPVTSGTAIARSETKRWDGADER